MNLLFNCFMICGGLPACWELACILRTVYILTSTVRPSCATRRRRRCAKPWSYKLHISNGQTKGTLQIKRSHNDFLQIYNQHGVVICCDCFSFCLMNIRSHPMFVLAGFTDASQLFVEVSSCILTNWKLTLVLEISNRKIFSSPGSYVKWLFNLPWMLPLCPQKQALDKLRGKNGDVKITAKDGFCMQKLLGGYDQDINWCPDWLRQIWSKDHCDYTWQWMNL